MLSKTKMCICGLQCGAKHGCANPMCRTAVHLACGFVLPGSPEGAEQKVACYPCALQFDFPNMDEFLIKKWRTQFFTVLDTPDTPISPIRLPYSSTTSMNPLGSCSSNGTSFSSSSSSNSSPESSASSWSSPPFLSPSPSPSSSPSSPSPCQPNEFKRKFTQFNAILSPSPSSTSAIPKKLDFVSPVQKSKNGGKKMGSSPQSPHSAQLLKNDDIF
jgi:hypothetical protein